MSDNSPFVPAIEIIKVDGSILTVRLPNGELAVAEKDKVVIVKLSGGDKNTQDS